MKNYHPHIFGWLIASNACLTFMPIGELPNYYYINFFKHFFHQSNFMKAFIIPSFIVLILAGCGNEPKKPKIDEEYLQRFNKISEMRGDARMFFLKLIAMEELMQDSIFTFGAHPDNTFSIKVEDAPNFIGSYAFNDSTLVFTTGDSVTATNKEEEVITSYAMPLSDSGFSEMLSYKNLTWFVAIHGGRYFLRIQDENSAALAQFKGFEVFEPTDECIYVGKINRFEEPKVISVPTVFGFNEDVTFIGTVAFEHDGETYELLMEEGGFIMFTDETSADETYGAGRYLRIRKPVDGYAIVDFNYAFNPPCSFSAYTTCQFPPKENRLPFKVMAGEKSELKSNI